MLSFKFSLQLLRDNLTLWTSDLQDGEWLLSVLLNDEGSIADQLSLIAPEKEAATKDDEAVAEPTGEEAA